VQRGGTPTAFDRVLSTRFGIAAIDAVHEGAWGQMVALHSDEITLVPLADVVGHERTCPDSLYYGVAGWFWAE
jgi:6-phosphofructokinase 1